jgi:SAM-dependent methyltransferase
MLSFVRRVERALRVYGPKDAVRRGWSALRSLPAERRGSNHDDFDDEMGVSTAGIVRLESLSVPAESRRLGHRYQPSDPATLRRTISALPIRYEEFAFVDIGSGKGRALLVASEFPFERIVGVELSQELNEVALENIAAYANPAQRCRAIEAHCADATGYELPRAGHANGAGERRRLPRGSAAARVRRPGEGHAVRRDGRGGRLRPP